MQIPEGSEDLDNYFFNNDDFNYVYNDSDFSHVDSDISDDGLEHFDICINDKGSNFRVDNADESDLRGFLYHWSVKHIKLDRMLLLVCFMA